MHLSFFIFAVLLTSWLPTDLLLANCIREPLLLEQVSDYKEYQIR